MGNCKSSFGSSDSPSTMKGPKTSDKRQRKFMPSFLRVAKRRSNKIAPDVSPTNATSSCSEFPSSHRLHEIFCRPSTSSNQNHFSSDCNADCGLNHHVENRLQETLSVDYDSTESSPEGLDSEDTTDDEIDLKIATESSSDTKDTTGDEVDLEIGTQGQIQSIDSGKLQQQCTFDDVHVVPQVSEKLLKLRKIHIGQRMAKEMQELSTVKEKLQGLQEHQDDRHNSLLFLTTVRARTASASRKASKLNKSIKKVSKDYGKHEKRLCKERAKRAVCVAKVDRYITKLYPAVRYTDIYARRQSFYLSPIPEESELDLEEYELGIFPSETNTSLAAIALRQNKLFLDASPSS